MSSNNCNDNIYCIDDFKIAIEKLRKNRSYSDIDGLIIKALHNKVIDDFMLKGTNLNRSSTHPYVKLDVGGRSGYRLYYIAIVHNSCIYLGFIHPKVGSEGSTNTTTAYRSELHDKLALAIKKRNLYKVNILKSTLQFELLKSEKVKS